MGFEKQVNVVAFDGAAPVFYPASAITGNFHDRTERVAGSVRCDGSPAGLGTGSSDSDLFSFALVRTAGIDRLHEDIPVPFAALLAAAIAGGQHLSSDVLAVPGRLNPCTADEQNRQKRNDDEPDNRFFHANHRGSLL
mgnify:CR=1 FL=1